MPQFEGVNVTKYDAGTENANWIDQGLIKSSLKVWSDSYVALGTEVVADTLVVAELPAGAVIHGIQLTTSALGAARTLTCGDANTAALYKAAIDVSAAVTDNSLLAAGNQYVIGTNANDERILLTLGGDVLTIGDVIKTQIFYTN